MGPGGKLRNDAPVPLMQSRLAGHDAGKDARTFRDHGGCRFIASRFDAEDARRSSCRIVAHFESG
jgi:hypothetical protein